MDPRPIESERPDDPERRRLSTLARRVAALEEADRRKDELLAILAHELRNPVCAIETSLFLPDRLGAQDAQNIQLRAIVHRQVKLIARLVDDLLDVSRIARGKLELRRERTDLARAVEQAVQTAKPRIEAARHVLEVALPGAPVEADADPARIVQVVANLLDNAAKYTEPGGRIAVSLEREGGGARAAIRVRDSGLGIAPEALERIFDLFVQGDRSLARAAGGLGIGLAMVRTLVELHGGTVTAMSEGPGKGSEFVVRLPLLAPAKPAEQAPRASALDRHSAGALQ